MTPADPDDSRDTTAPLGDGRRELANLTARLLEQERLNSRKLARQLHDELGQTLAALRLHWEAQAGGPRGELDERIASLIVLANRQMRSVLAELSPPLLDELGLAAALDNEIRQHQAGDAEPRLELRVSHNAEVQRWPVEVEYAAFMIAREALQNSLRHAGARHIRISLDGDEQLLELAIQDDGRGFTPQAEQLGLVGMRERALTINAHLHIDGRPGHGTMVELTWLPSEEGADDEPHLPD